MSRYKLTANSNNKKTGPIALVMSSEDTCWTGCALYDCCYRKNWPICKHQKDLNTGVKGTDFPEVMDALRCLPIGSIWRWGDVGDLPGANGCINVEQLEKLTSINKERKFTGFAYTHKPMLYGSFAESNRSAVAAAVQGGFAINLSAEGLNKADVLADLDIAPVATALPTDLPDSWRSLVTPAGRRVLRCPAEWLSRGGCKTQCATCGGNKGPICSWADRDFIIGFTAHGYSKRVSQRINEVEQEYEANQLRRV